MTRQGETPSRQAQWHRKKSVERLQAAIGTELLGAHYDEAAQHFVVYELPDGLRFAGRFHAVSSWVAGYVARATRSARRKEDT